MVAELGPSNVVDSSYEQVDLIPVPEDLKPLYEPYELVGVSWQMFLFMTTAERRLVHSHVGSLHEKTLLIEKQAVICKASQRISHTRSDCDSQILDWFAKNTVHTTFDHERAAATGYEPVLTIENHQDPYKDTTISSSAFPKDKPQTSSETTSSYSAPKVNRKFSGLVNQSSTCYLNALLQALFHLPVFRRTIYSMPVPENPNPKSSVSLAMQELFFNLERKKGKNKTTNLTAAFGWDSQEAAVQHDIHELVRKLLDVLEANYGSLPHGERNPIQRIFCGTKLYYSKCIDVDYTYQREETLYDVELVVKTHANIEESLKAETTAERLEGGNKYCWEHDDEPRDPVTNKYRKTYHDADRGSAFKELPPVLMIHPNRLDFDLTTFQKITVNSEWQFAETLDMSPYVIASEANPVANHVMLQRAQSTCPTEVDGAYSESTGMSRRETSAASTGGADTTDTTMTRPEHSGMGDATMTAPPENPYMYDLRSVVIHSGAASFGHYYCYVNDNGEWIKFNDETVTDTTFAAMCKEAFGGMTTTTSGYQYASSTRASLLVYVRRELKDTVLLDVTEEDIPPPLKAFFEEEQGREAKDAEEAARLASLCSVAIIRLDQSEKGFNELRLPRLATVSKLPPDQLISEGLEDCTLWLMDAYYNYTVHYRSTHYEAIKLNGTEKVGEKFPVPAYYSPNHVVSKVLIAVPHSVATPPPTLGDTPELSDWTRRLRGSTNPCLLVVYEYIRGQGIVYQSIVQTREELVRRYYPTEEEGLADKPQILIESQRKLYTVPDPQGLYGGDIVVLVRPSEGTDFDAVRAFNMMYNYLDVTVYRMRTSQLPVGVVIEEPEDAAGQHDVDQPTEIGTIRLVENDTFDDVQTAVADYLSDPSIDPKCIAFRSHDANADAPHKQLASRNSFDYYGHATGLRDVRGILGDRQGIMICKLYFEVLPMPVEKFEALGLRDYVAVRGTTRLRFVGRKPTSTSLYTEHMRDLRKLAADALGLSVNRVAIASVNYDGVTDSISMDPHEVTATPPPQPTSAAAASPSAAGTADEVYPTAEARDAESPAVGEPVTSPDAPPRGNDDDEWGQVRRGNGRRQTSSSNGTPSSSGRARGDPTDDSDDADAPYSKLHDNDQTATVESPAAQNPLTAGYGPSTLPTTQSTTTSAAASTAFASAVSSPRTDICVPYSKPTYMNLDSTYFIVVPEVPAAEPYVAPHEDDAAPALPPRWIFLVIQHCVNRSRKDFFGFACGVWVRDTDTGKVARGRILATLGVEEAAATNWKLLALKQSSSASMALVGDETKLSDVFNFNTTYFNGSLVLERPLPTGLATRNHRVASAEPELRINAPRNSASTQDVTSQQGALSRP